MAASELFRTTLIGGYRKEDVQEYINFLKQENQTLKEEKQADGEKVSKEQLKKLDVLSKKLEERERVIKELELKLEEKKAAEKNCDEKEKQLDEMIEEYGKRSSALSEILMQAKIQADQIICNADVQADSVIKQAQNDADLHKQAADTALNDEIFRRIEQMLMMKLKMNEYLDILDELQDGIQKIYSTMSKSVREIPTSVDEIKHLTDKSVVEEKEKPEEEKV